VGEPALLDIDNEVCATPHQCHPVARRFIGFATLLQQENIADESARYKFIEQPAVRGRFWKNGVAGFDLSLWS
jgi:hypothetical protein